jgi:hypothetical protein
MIDDRQMIKDVAYGLWLAVLYDCRVVMLVIFIGIVGRHFL